MGGARARAISRRLPHAVGAGALARELVMELLADARTTDELRHDAALVTYELVANAVMHGRPHSDGTVEMACELIDDVLVVQVRDAGQAGALQPRPLEPEVGHGRGLAIVDALSSAWHVDRTNGTTVTAWVPLSWQSTAKA